MSYVIAAPCVADYSCVEVCPVDCISPGVDEAGFDRTEQLYINPVECIDCRACVETCPVDAIFPADRMPDRYARYSQINADYFRADGRR